MLLANALCVILYMASALFVLKRCREHLVFFGYLVFAQTWSLISCFYNDTGIYNMELFRFTETTFATSRLAVFYMVFNLGLLTMAKFISKRPLARSEYRVVGSQWRLGNMKLVAYGLVGCVILYVAYSLGTEGVPLFEGIDRVTFLKEAGPVERVLQVYGPAIAFMIAFYRRKTGLFTINTLMIFLLLAFSILTSNKFSALVRVLIAFSVPVYVRSLMKNPERSILRARHVFSLIGVAIVFLTIAYFSYVSNFGSSNVAGLLLIDRILAFQGQMWWAVDYQLFVQGMFDSGHWLDELRAIISFGAVPEASYGMKYLMLQVLGAGHAFPIFDVGYLYTMAYPAILVATFPYPLAIVIQFSAGMAFLLLLHHLYYSTRYNHPVRAILSLMVVTYFFGMILHGDFILFFNWRVIVLIVLLSVMEAGLGNSDWGGKRLGLGGLD